MIQLTAEVRPDVDVIFKTEVDLGQVRTWSYSALKVFEECPYRTYISRVKKITEPTNPAAKRGSDIHQQAEDYGGTAGACCCTTRCQEFLCNCYDSW